MKSDELLLIDLSALAHQIYHVSGSEPDPSFVSNQIVARVRGLSTEHPHAAICCDCPPYLRKDIDPSYKATRPDTIAPLIHQMQVAEERLRQDGYPVWKVRGFEADDIIATATHRALGIEGTSVLIASSDKDLLQLVCDYVSTKSLTTGNVVDAAAVEAKFGVRPDQMLDYLCLVGDTSDNIIGAKGIGGVRAASLLKAHGSLAAVYEAMKAGVVPGMTPSQRSSLVEFAERWPTVRDLITLRTDVAIPFEEIAVERTAPPMVEETEVADEQAFECKKCGYLIYIDAEDGHEHDADSSNFLHICRSGPEPDRELTGAEATAAVSKAFTQATASLPKNGPAPVLVSTGAPHPAQPLTGPVVASYGAPVEFSQALEPRNMDEAVRLAQRMFESRLFSAYGTAQAVLATVLAGRELGIPAMASLRAFHIIEGKPTLSAGTIQSLVLKSGKAHYFRCSERTSERATFVTQRGDDPPMSLTFTVEDGRRAWPKDDAAFAKSGWGRNPADMCVARASSKLARLVYPDVVSGLYAPEEME